MTTTNPTATATKTAPFKFTKPEQERLQSAQRELERLDAKLLEVIDLKPAIAQVGADFAAGRIELVHAAALLTASSEERHALQQALKPHVKGAMREAVAIVSDLLTKARQHHIDELARIANGIEATERKTQMELGMAEDDFTPSAALAGLRVQHQRSRSTLEYPPSRSELNAILAAL